MRQLVRAFAPSLCVCLLCVAAAYCLQDSLSTPGLTLRLSASGDGGIALRFANQSRRDIVLDAGAMEFFLAPPVDGSNDLFVYVRNKPRAFADAERDSRRIVLSPGETQDLGNLSVLLERLPPGAATLTAIYSVPDDAPRLPGSWSGLVRSLPISVDIV